MRHKIKEIHDIKAFFGCTSIFFEYLPEQLRVELQNNGAKCEVMAKASELPTLHHVVVQCFSQQWPPALCRSVLRDLLVSWPSDHAQQCLSRLLSTLWDCGWRPPSTYASQLLRIIMRECDSTLHEELADSVSTLISGDLGPFSPPVGLEDSSRIGVRLFGVIQPSQHLPVAPSIQIGMSDSKNAVSLHSLGDTLKSFARVASSGTFSDIGLRCWPSTHLLVELLEGDSGLKDLIADKRVVELGSGTGAAALLLAGLPAARRPCGLLLTELHRVAGGLLLHNAKVNANRDPAPAWIEKTTRLGLPSKLVGVSELVHGWGLVAAAGSSVGLRAASGSLACAEQETQGFKLGAMKDGRLAAQAPTVFASTDGDAGAGSGAASSSISREEVAVPAPPLLVAVAPLNWVDVASGDLPRALSRAGAVGGRESFGEDSSGAGAEISVEGGQPTQAAVSRKRTGSGVPSKEEGAASGGGGCAGPSSSRDASSSVANAHVDMKRAASKATGAALDEEKPHSGPSAEEDRRCSLEALRALQMADVVFGTDVVYDAEAAAALAKVVGFAFAGNEGGPLSEGSRASRQPDVEVGDAATAIASCRKVGLFVNVNRNPATQAVFLDGLLEQGLRYEDVSPQDWPGAALPSSAARRAGGAAGQVRQFVSQEDTKPAAEEGNATGTEEATHPGSSEELNQAAAGERFQREVQVRAMALRLPVDPGTWLAPIRALLVWAP